MAIFQRLLVLLEKSDTDEAAFAQALDLARRLDTPVEGVFLPVAEYQAGLSTDLPGRSVSPAPSQGLGWSSTMKEVEARYAASCARVNVHWQASCWDGHVVAGLRAWAGPTDLLTFGRTLRPTLQHELLRESLRPGFPAVLVCPPEAPAVSRVLVVDRGVRADGQSFLASAIVLCRRLRAQPIVLTVARSEWAARARQQAARDVVAALGPDADFDFIVGTDVRTAVARVARWRRCSLVVAARPGRMPWLRWWCAPSDAWLLGGAAAFSVLSLPGTDVAPDYQPWPTPGPPLGSSMDQGLLPVPPGWKPFARDNPGGPAREFGARAR